MRYGLLLILALVVCLPPLLVSLGVRDTTHTMEQVALVSSQETFLRQHGWEDIPKDDGAWWRPTWQGRERINKPPLLVWMNLLAWSDLTPESSSPELLTHRARLVTVGLGLVTLAAVFWMGLALGGRTLAVLAALIAGSMWFFVRQARTASYDIHMTAWVTLGVAAALWAMQPLRQAVGRRRWRAGWAVSGVALAAAWLTKGPLSLLIWAVPVIGALALFPRRSRRTAASQDVAAATSSPPGPANWPGAVLALLVAAALVLPWYAWIAARVPEAFACWLKEFRAQRQESQTPFYYLAFFGLAAPWTLWLIGGLAHPFMRCVGVQRRAALMPWLWFVAILVIFSIPGAKQQRYILPIVPAAALLAARVLSDHQALALAGRADPGAARLYWPHWVGLLLVSLAIGPALLSQDWLVRHGWIAHAPLGTVAWSAALGLGAALTAMAGMGLHWHRRGQARGAGVATAVWALILVTFAFQAYSHNAGAVHPVKPGAQRVAQAARGRVLCHLTLGQRVDQANEEFMFYSRRVPRPVTPGELAGLPDQRSPRPHWQPNGPPMVMAFADDQHDAVMRAAGYVALFDFLNDVGYRYRLWDLAAPRSATMPAGQPAATGNSP